MKKILSLLALTLIISAASFTASAQCKGFAKKVCKLDLIPYIHDGNYHAAILTEGEEAELYKTFYADQEYRIAICVVDAFPQIEFKIYDSNRKLIYNNRDHHMSRIWDFKPEASQQLKIVVKVPASGSKKSDSEVISGCVAIMFGIKDKK
ncbi:MAG: hypothetical protein Q8928_12445 [Bacteroidota bacterium]|nr:hypothetical protein [Bacteroidota bacterium]